VIFDNSYTVLSQVVNTCGRSAQTLGLSSNQLTVGIPIVQGGRNITVPATVDIYTSYTYHFPANGGIWLIDNLSAPGGPGGGWAFSYSSCA
jgi:hypothetical protein